MHYTDRRSGLKISRVRPRLGPFGDPDREAVRSIASALDAASRPLTADAYTEAAARRCWAGVAPAPRRFRGWHEVACDSATKITDMPLLCAVASITQPGGRTASRPTTPALRASSVAASASLRRLGIYHVDLYRCTVRPRVPIEETLATSTPSCTPACPLQIGCSASPPGSCTGAVGQRCHGLMPFRTASGRIQPADREGERTYSRDRGRRSACWPSQVLAVGMLTDASGQMFGRPDPARPPFGVPNRYWKLGFAELRPSGRRRGGGGARGGLATAAHLAPGSRRDRGASRTETLDDAVEPPTAADRRLGHAAERRDERCLHPGPDDLIASTSRLPGLAWVTARHTHRSNTAAQGPASRPSACGLGHETGGRGGHATRPPSDSRRPGVKCQRWSSCADGQWRLGPDCRCTALEGPLFTWPTFRSRP